MSEHDFLVDLSCFYLNELGVLHLKEWSRLDVELADDMWPLDAEVDISEDGWDIFISDKLCKSEIIRALAHECVHIKQYVKGELVEKETEFFWKGELYLYDQENYEQMPWEEEAYRLENELVEKYERYK